MFGNVTVLTISSCGNKFFLKITIKGTRIFPKEKVIKLKRENKTNPKLFG